MTLCRATEHQSKASPARLGKAVFLDDMKKFALDFADDIRVNSGDIDTMDDSDSWTFWSLSILSTFMSLESHRVVIPARQEMIVA